MGRGEPRLFLGLLERTDFNPGLAACLAQTPKSVESPHLGGRIFFSLPDDSSGSKASRDDANSAKRPVFRCAAQRCQKFTTAQAGRPPEADFRSGGAQRVAQKDQDQG